MVRALILLIGLLLTAYDAAAQTRIVSTSPSITETLFALGLGERVVGVSQYCRFPEAAAKLPKVGTFLRPNAELIARLGPDLVVLHAGPNATGQHLAALKLPFITVERGTLPSVFSTIREIGKAALVPERADALVLDITRRLEAVRASVAGRPVKRALIIVGRRSGALSDIVAVGRGSYLTDILVMAGGVNVLADAAQVDYPRISMETIIRLQPDVIIEAGEMELPPAERDRRRVATEALWSAQALVTAARDKRVFVVTDDAFVVAGPRVVDVAQAMATWLHGVAAK